MWSGEKGKKKYHLVNWQEVCLPKDQGGLGVPDLEIMNIALLSKWLWKLFNENGPGQQIIKAKYLCNQNMCQVSKKNGDSHFWQGLMEVKHLFWACCKVKIGRGDMTSGKITG